MGSPPASRGLGLVGGRFWALANEDDDLQNTPAASPTPSDIVCESILVGYSEEQVAESIDGFVPDSDPAWDGLTTNDEDRVEVLRRVVHRQTSANAVRPWKGLLPKVRLPALTLAGFFHSCKQALVRKSRRPAAISRPTAHASAKTDLGIHEAKEFRLKSILCQDGPESQAADFHTPGYMAQSVVRVHQIPDFLVRTLSGIDLVTDVVTEGPSSGDSPIDNNERGSRSGISAVSRQANPGFPSRYGTARRIPALAPMAARQGVPSTPAASASAGTAPAATASAAAGPAAGVSTAVAAGARENSQRATVPIGQGRGSAGAGRGGPGANNRGGGGGFHGHRGCANH
ncbi:hypothetical protein ZWY2020_033377 [Hordeum vulgare]|nr:hypothetical protein ZWY2020_033377 [Hordeum vulgare]